MLFDRLMRGANIAFILARWFPTTLLRMISSRTHAEILSYFRQTWRMMNRASRLISISISIALLALFTFAGQEAALAQVKPIPSPSPKWPPIGFTGKDGVYAKIASQKELVGLLSAKTVLQKTFMQCKEFACGAVIVASETGCAWWEVTSIVSGPDPATSTQVRLGTLSTYDDGTRKRELRTIFLISGAKVAAGVTIGKIKVICHPPSDNAKKPGNIYTPIEM